MPAWTAFAAVAGVVTVLLLLLSHTTSQRFGDSEDGSGGQDSVASPREDDPVGATPRPDAPPGEPVPEGVREDAEARRDGQVGRVDGGRLEGEGSPVALPGGRERTAARELQGAPSLSQPMLLLNVALSQGAFGAVLVVAAVLAEVPRAALGVDPAALSGLLALVGVALGVALYAADEVGAWLAEVVGLGRSEALREWLAPDSTLGWIVLLGGVLPIVAGFEELLFRGILVGAFATGFGWSPWLLAVASSVAFGLGHGAQGRLGVLVTTGLGLVLAAAFVVTGSLLVVVVAHYLVNALEFVVHEGR